MINDYNKCVSIGGRGGSNACKRGWGSFHESVIPFAMVDGSVTLISKNIDMDILGAMATIGGAEVAFMP
ncbi:MAG: DUF1559 domain-containing protein [Planctomycetes bacterium]|nr:DUF1559 domain-containing protein [Planctomycetota bacterium]